MIVRCQVTMKFERGKGDVKNLKSKLDKIPEEAELTIQSTGTIIATWEEDRK